MIERYWAMGTRAFGSAAAIVDAGGGVAVHAAMPNASPGAIPSRNAGADHRCPSMILKTSCVNQRSVPRNADTLRLKDSAQRSWRTVETARRYAAVQIIGGDSQAFADNVPRLDHDWRGKESGKVGMQCAAGISQVDAVVTVMMDVPFVGVVVAMLMMAVRSSRVLYRLRVGARRRHDARELGDHE